MTNHDNYDLGDDLRITKTTRRASGGRTWVCGTIAGMQTIAECSGFRLASTAAKGYNLEIGL